MLHGCDQRGRVTSKRVALLRHEFRDVVDVKDGFGAVALECVAAHAELDRAAFLLGAMGIVVGVPLQSTLSQLQHLYELVLERELDKRRFDERTYKRLAKAGFNFEL